MESFIGQMEEFIKVYGKMENNMEEAFIKDHMVLKEKANGLKVKKLNGLIDDINEKNIFIVKLFYFLFIEY